MPTYQSFNKTKTGSNTFIFFPMARPPRLSPPQADDGGQAALSHKGDSHRFYFIKEHRHAKPDSASILVFKGASDSIENDSYRGKMPLPLFKMESMFKTKADGY